MAAYVIANMDIKDPAGYEEYRKLSRPAIEKYGGKAIVRNGQFEVRDGGWTPKRLVILEFESYEQARIFYDSPEYRAARAIKEKCADTELVIVEGL